MKREKMEPGFVVVVRRRGCRDEEPRFGSVMVMKLVKDPFKVCSFFGGFEEAKA